MLAAHAAASDFMAASAPVSSGHAPPSRTWCDGAVGVGRDDPRQHDVSFRRDARRERAVGRATAVYGSVRRGRCRFLALERTGDSSLCAMERHAHRLWPAPRCWFHDGRNSARRPSVHLSHRVSERARWHGIPHCFSARQRSLCSDPASLSLLVLLACRSGRRELVLQSTWCHELPPSTGER